MSLTPGYTCPCFVALPVPGGKTPAPHWNQNRSPPCSSLVTLSRISSKKKKSYRVLSSQLRPRLWQGESFLCDPLPCTTGCAPLQPGNLHRQWGSWKEASLPRPHSPVWRGKPSLHGRLLSPVCIALPAVSSSPAFYSQEFQGNMVLVHS